MEGGEKDSHLMPFPFAPLHNPVPSASTRAGEVSSAIDFIIHCRRQYAVTAENALLLSTHTMYVRVVGQVDRPPVYLQLF